MLNSATITQYLQDYHNGDPIAIEELFPIVYNELKNLAHGQLRKSWSIETICTTALVNEAYVKLISSQDQELSNRAHFFALAATAMRQIIINYAEKKQSQKRGGEWQQVTMSIIDAEVSETKQELDWLLEVNDAVDKIHQIDEDIAQLVELRFFAGMTEVEVATLLGVNERTIRRRWQKARALLTQHFAN